ncbi:MAG: hypothetical protein BXU00_02050 [Candidatus Nanoclepta minutus]|uniref:Calcineurin-like phosphoesterase domain-containing protein n=1 Tax=Candidatus Nanoclepta minutus TaxID=1940235 RepID=A0A397WN14_9ARCH|nr:MAG: hypothetical protein BXU00_02050 [Candidatus Nanoclepta minutus]
MKVLVLSDIHYPNCNIDEIKNIIEGEKPDKIVLLGDIANCKDCYNIIISIIKNYSNEIEIICGDNEKKFNINCYKYLIIDKILIYHGDNINLISEFFTKIIAKIFYKISRSLLKEIVSFLVKSNRYTIVIGHSHLLGKSRLFNVYFAGTLCKKHYFLERGYIVIKDGKIFIKKIG